MRNQAYFVLPTPYKSQLDNDQDWNSGWWNECSYVCKAMFLAAMGFVGNGNGQFEDQIERKSEAAGFMRGEPYGMNEFMRTNYRVAGTDYIFKPDATWEELEDNLLIGYPAILHTWLTGSGHVILLNGWNEAAYGGRGAYLFHDPYGEWYPAGYDTSASGENVPYSFDLCKRLIGTDGDMWAHMVVQVK